MISDHRDEVKNLNGGFDSVSDETRIRLPRSETDRWYLRSGVELKEPDFLCHGYVSRPQRVGERVMRKMNEFGWPISSNEIVS
ncbi:hypothetical protein F2Q70_00024891 [Brassica cretica]|uniref:Uncharacterized protein n=1 Tax=Brassica cretica TaxID=69181 RepID=A0A8S9LG65_BRACR|nr:hypothetical protein F2Q70_00024891 [Brassica cretica]